MGALVIPPDMERPGTTADLAILHHRAGKVAFDPNGHVLEAPRTLNWNLVAHMELTVDT